ncbi:MAG: hypothetical protein RLZZ77_1362, partial [Bacteroidota bacterium]
MSKSKFLFLFALLVSIVSNAQWPLFNEVHPVSIQSPAYNYTAHGHFGNVIVIDTIPNYYDGYLVFGNGVLCHPDSAQNYMRKFSAKCNINGEMMWWRRYDENSADINEQWYNYAGADYGGIFMNSLNRIVGITTNFSFADNTGSESRNFLVEINLEGEIVEQYLVDSSANRFFFLGMMEDTFDSGYLGFGYLQDSLAVINQDNAVAFLLKIDFQGNHIWRRTYTNTFCIGPRGVVKAMDGGFWLVCYKDMGEYCSDNSSQNMDVVIIKTDANGIEEARYQMGGSCGDGNVFVYEYELDKIALFGRLTSEELEPMPYEGYMFSALMEQLPSGELSEPSEMKNYFGGAGGSPSNFHHPVDGKFILTGGHGFEDNVFGDVLDGFIFKLDENRDSLWCRRYSYYEETINFDNAQNLIMDSKVMSDGGIVCVGKIIQGGDNPNPNLHTPWIFRVDSLGCLEPGCQFVDVQEVVVGLQNTMSIYPNPA